MQPSATHSRVVPSWAAVWRHSSSTSSSVAQRLGTGWPSQSLWVKLRPVESPSPPAASDSSKRARMAAISSGPASWPTARSPMTTRRRAQWPTMKPTLTAGRRACTASR